MMIRLAEIFPHLHSNLIRITSWDTLLCQFSMSCIDKRSPLLPTIEIVQIWLLSYLTIHRFTSRLGNNPKWSLNIYYVLCPKFDDTYQMSMLLLCLIGYQVLFVPPPAYHRKPLRNLCILDKQALSSNSETFYLSHIQRISNMKTLSSSNSPS